MVDFLSLPAEIRLRIYEHLYASEPSRLVLHLKSNKNRVHELPAHRGILRASRQCYEEAAPLHQESLTHLYVQCDSFNVFKPGELRPDSLRQYDRLFDRVFWSVPLDGHTRQLFADIRTLTVPAFISADTILDTFERSGLRSLETIEFVSHQSSILDQYPSSPLDHAGRQHNCLAMGQQQHGRTVQWVVTSTFRPFSHLAISMFPFKNMNLPKRTRRGESPNGRFRVLWTTRARWERQSGELGDDELGAQRRVPGTGPCCHLIDFKYTLDCVDLKLKKIEILSRTKCQIEGCSNRDDEETFLRYLGPEVCRLLSGQHELARTSMTS